MHINSKDCVHVPAQLIVHLLENDHGIKFRVSKTNTCTHTHKQTHAHADGVDGSDGGDGDGGDLLSACCLQHCTPYLSVVSSIDLNLFLKFNATLKLSMSIHVQYKHAIIILLNFKKLWISLICNKIFSKYYTPTL